MARIVTEPTAGLRLDQALARLFPQFSRTRLAAWLRGGRIDGIIIYGTAMDLGWECVDWARNWIQRVGDTPL